MTIYVIFGAKLQKNVGKFVPTQKNNYLCRDKIEIIQIFNF
jgi:hypothetical protein